jgi:hypothetical protein
LSCRLPVLAHCEQPVLVKFPKNSLLAAIRLLTIEVIAQKDIKVDQYALGQKGWGATVTCDHTLDIFARRSKNSTWYIAVVMQPPALLKRIFIDIRISVQVQRKSC